MVRSILFFVGLVVAILFPFVGTAQFIDAGEDVSICGVSAKLNAVAPGVGYHGTWAIKIGSARIEDAVSNTSTISDMAEGETTFIWSVYNAAGILMGSDEVTVTNLSVEADAGDDLTFSGSNVQLNANLPDGTSGRWEVSSGDALVLNVTNPQSQVLQFGETAIVLKWTLKNGGCEDSDAITLTPGATEEFIAGPDFSVCSSSAQLDAFRGTNETGEWSKETDNSATFSAKNSPSCQVYNLPTGESTFYWRLLRDSQELNDEVTVTNNAVIADGGEDLTISEAYTRLDASLPDGASGRWFAVSGAVTFANPQNPKTSIFNVAEGETVLLWAVTKGKCVEGDSITITRTVPLVANAGQNQIVCSEQAQLFANSIADATGQWSVVSGEGIYIPSPELPNTFVYGLPKGQSTLSWTLSRDGEQSVGEMQITNNEVDAYAGEDFEQTESSAFLNARLHSDELGYWSTRQGAGTYRNELAASTEVLGLYVGENVFRWTVKKGECTDIDSVTVTRLVELDAYAGDNQEICTDETYLAGRLPTGASGYWSTNKSGVEISNSATPLTYVRHLPADTTQFVWHIAQGSQTDSDTVLVINNSVVADAGANVTVTSSSYRLQANEPLWAEGVWDIIVGHAVFENKKSGLSQIYDLKEGYSTLEWGLSKGKCYDSDQVRITRQTFGADAGPDLSTCSHEARLRAKLPEGAEGRWSTDNTSIDFDSYTDPSTMAYNFLPGETKLTWTVKEGQNTATDVLVVTNNSVQAYAGQDKVIETNSVALDANFPSGGTGVWGSDKPVLFQDIGWAKTTAFSLSEGRNVFYWTVTKGQCTSADTVNIFFDPDLSFTAGKDTVICTSTLQLYASLPDNTAGRWRASNSEIKIHSPIEPTSEISNIPLGTSILYWDVEIKDEIVTDSVRVENKSLTTQVGDDVLVTKVNYALYGVLHSDEMGKWTVLSGRAILQNTANPETAVYNLSEGKNTFRWTVTNGHCFASDEQVITRSAFLVDAGLDVLVCGTTAELDALPAEEGTSGIWTTNNGNVIISNKYLYNTKVLELPKGETQFTWTVTNGEETYSDNLSVFNNSVRAYAGINFKTAETTVQLTGSLPSGSSGRWAVENGGAFIENPSTTSATISGLTEGYNIFSWTVTNGMCNSTDKITVTYDPNYSNILSINEFKLDEMQVVVSEGALRVSFPRVANGVLKLVSINGKSILQKNIQNTKQITLQHNLNSGVYVVLFHSNKQLMGKPILIP